MKNSLETVSESICPQVGTFFAVGSCVGLIGSPLMALLLKKGLAPKTMVLSGLTLAGLTLTAHGFFKDFFQDGEAFFYANLITRIVHSIGPVAATTAIYPIVAVEMKEKRGTYLPILEAFYNVGLMVWPSIGAILYERYGYTFPFVSVGVGSLVICFILAILLPSPKKTTGQQTCPSGEDARPKPRSMDFTLGLVLANIAICYLVIGFNDITLSVELEAFELTHTQIGYCFAVATVSYGVSIYLWTMVCRTRAGTHLTLIVGYAISVVGLFLLAPCGLIAVEPTLHVRLGGQAVIGIGMAALFASSMLRGMKYLTEELQMPDDVSTHGFFSGLLFFSLCFGYLAGHAAFAGFMLDLLSYQLVVLLIILVFMIFFLINILNMLLCGTSLRREYETIIGSDYF